jgi:uncharacterized repeat protein (TIGR01451 family)
MKRNILSYLGAGALLLAAAPGAFAQTAAGTAVDNTASVTFTVSGVEQTTHPEGSVEFQVDRRIDLSVAESGDNVTSVVPGAQNQVLKYTVTNDTNDVIDIALSAADAGDGTVFLAGANPDQTDTADTGATYTLYADTNTNGTYDSGTDQPLPNSAGVQYLDQVAAGATRTVFVVADQLDDDTVLSNNDVMVVQLTGTARSAYADQRDTSSAAGTNSLGAVFADDSGSADVADEVDNVFADDAKAETGDVAGDGVDSAYDAYKVSSTTIDVTKTYGVVDDPLTNGGANPKAIPGATIVYCITVENNGSTDATDVTVSDNIPPNTTYVPGTLHVTPTAVDCGDDPDAAGNVGVGILGTLVSDTNADSDGGDAGGTGPTFSGPITTVTDVDAGDKTTTIFEVTID